MTTIETPSLPNVRTVPKLDAAAPSPPLLAVQRLSKRFAAADVLQEVSLEIAPGELVAIVGRSGSGKSTLLRVVAGLESPTSGALHWDGSPGRAGVNRRARLMFQDAALLPWLTVLDNVALAAPRGGDRRAAAERALRQVGLAARSREWPLVLSGGQRQRVALARVLASTAELVLLDEPLGALDALTRLEMQTLIEKIWQERGFAAVLVTHDVEEAVALADRVLLMEEGRLVFDTPVDLPRPRARASAAFVELKEAVLARVMRDR